LEKTKQNKKHRVQKSTLKYVHLLRHQYAKLLCTYTDKRYKFVLDVNTTLVCYCLKFI